MKKILAVIVAVLLVATLSFGISMMVSATDTEPKIVVSSGTANKGGTKDVTISIKNNPGIASLRLKVAFPSDLSLVPFGNSNYDGKYIEEDPQKDFIELFDEQGNLLVDPTEVTEWAKYDVVGIKGYAMQPEAVKDNSVTLNWSSPYENVTGDFTFATLKFKVYDSAELGEKDITVTYEPDDVYNADETNVAFETQNGKIEVTDVIKGDVNGDNVFDDDDAIHLLYHYVFPDDEDYAVNQPVDFDGNGVFNDDDAILLLYHYVFPDDEDYALK